MKDQVLLEVVCRKLNRQEILNAEYDLFLHLQLLREKVKDAVYWS